MQKYFIQNLFAEHNSNSNHQVQEIKMALLATSICHWQISNAFFLFTPSLGAFQNKCFSKPRLSTSVLTLHSVPVYKPGQPCIWDQRQSHCILTSAVQFTYKQTASRSTNFRLTDFRSSHKTPSLKVVETKHSLRPHMRMFMILSNHIPSP